MSGSAYPDGPLFFDFHALMNNEITYEQAPIFTAIDFNTVEAEKLQANELVKQFKIEMGLAAPDAASGATEKTIAAREPQKTS